MTAHPDEISTELPCHVCGYDLRAHPPDGKCPECGASVAEAKRMAAIPRRPAWRESDPRWRRRMLAGVWILVFLPLMDALRAFGWAERMPMPTVFDYRSTVTTLEDTLLCYGGVYPPLVFCIGVVLLFSNERRTYRGRLDWTRRWGVLCSYVVLLLSATQVLFIGALVMTGIAGLFMSMPLQYQPGVTELFVELSTFYLLYGAYPKDSTVVVLAAFSAITILLACIPLFDALRSSGPKRLAAILLAPLALFALVYLAQVAGYCLGIPIVISASVFRDIYFWPALLVNHLAGRPTWPTAGSGPSSFLVEAAKWSIVLAIAIWLSIAQIGAWRGTSSPDKQIKKS